MAHFYNAYNTSFYSAPTISGELEGHPFSNQASTMRETNVQTLSAFSDGWNVGGELGYLTDSSRGLRAEASLESVTPVTPYKAQTHSHRELSFPEYHWPTTNLHAQSHHSNIVSRNNSFPSVAASEVSTVVSAPRSVPLSYWRDNKSGPTASTFNTNVQIPHQYSTGSTRTGMMKTWRFRPYGTPSARSSERANTKAGSSTLAPPLIQYVAPLATYRSGGSSKTTAYAETKPTITEENAPPTTRRPQDTGKCRMGRTQYQQDVHRLRVWAQGWESLKKLPSHENALNIALQFVQTIREPVYDTPRLTRGRGTRTAQGEKSPDAEHRRRQGTREINEELSQYYELVTNQAAWGCPELLLKVLKDIDSLSEPPANSPA